MSIFHPVDWFRLWELHQLEKQQTRLQAQGLPIPGWLSAKITSLQADLSGS